MSESLAVQKAMLRFFIRLEEVKIAQQSRCDICGRWAKQVSPGVWRCTQMSYDHYAGGWEHA